MNLEFKTLQVRGNNRIQAADVTDSWEFWRELRSNPALASRITITRSGGRTYAVRVLPLDATRPTPRASLYCLRDRRNLYPYQVPAAERLCAALIRYGAAVDGSDTGTGKTFTALAAAREFGLRPVVITRRLVICNWLRECRYMGVAPYAVTNWESARSGKFPWLQRRRHPYSDAYVYRWRLPRGCIIIFDEAHLASGDDSQTAAMYVASVRYPSISSSATLADTPRKLRNLFHVLRIMKPSDFDRWLESRGAYIGAYSDKIESLTDKSDLQEAHHLLFPAHGCRVSAEDPDVQRHFPEGIYRTFLLNIGSKNIRTHNELYREILTKAEEAKTKGDSAEKAVRDVRFRQQTELLKLPLLAELTQNLITEGHSVVIFVNFRASLQYLQKLLRTKQLIYGQQKDDERQTVVDNFQIDKSHLVVCTGDAGGTGIGFHDTIGNRRRIALISPTYNSITLKQILGRVRRAGSKTTPLHYLIYAAGTVEEKVAKKVAAKLDNIAALNDGDLMETDLFNILKGE